MPATVLCPNPDCDASYSLNPADLGKGLCCKKCGWPLEGDAVPATRKTRPAFGQGMAGQPPRKDAYIGTTFANRYEIRDCLGRGGMGAVYRAWDAQLDRDVALKFPFIEEDPDGEILKRFQREARAAAKLRHPNLCPVYDVGTHDGQPFLTMAYIEGTSLADYLRQGKAPLDPIKAARIVRVIARALQQAHEAGIIHRDLKPGNIMVSREGRPVVMDFGLARRDDLADSLRTRTGQMMGTPAYMPLEQFRGDVRGMGPGCDIYSLGVILFQLLTGRLPYEGPPVSVFEKLLRGDPPPAPSTYRPGLDKALEAICLKAMARQVGDRYPAMTAFAAALDAWMDCAGAIEPTNADRTQGTNPARERKPLRDEIRPAAAGFTRDRGISRTWTALGLVGLLPLLGITIYFITNYGTKKGTGTEAQMEDSEMAVVSPLSPEPKPARSTERPKPDSSESPTEVAEKADTAPPSQERPSEFAGTRAGQEWSDNGIGLVFCWCPPGSFTMGSPADEPGRDNDEGQKSVNLSRGFWMGQFEVTQEQYHQVMDQNPSWFSATGGGKDKVAGQDTARFPVENVSWDNATEFCKRLTDQERDAGRLPPGWVYSLPTEAQWEYASRAGTTTATAFGDTLSSRQANFDGNYPYNGAEKGPYLAQTAEVGSYG